MDTAGCGAGGGGPGAVAKGKGVAGLGVDVCKGMYWQRSVGLVAREAIRRKEPLASGRKVSIAGVFEGEYCLFVAEN